MRGRAAVVLALAAALALAGCGRRGSPELPEAARDMPRAEIHPQDPGGPTAPDRDFILDPILQ